MKRFSFNGFLKERGDTQSYEVKVLGSALCSHPGADEICRAMGEKYTASRDRINKIPSQNMTVTSKGIQLEKGLTGSDGSLKKFVIERIVYCGVDKQHQKIFGFFYRAPDNLYGGLDCHVVECRSKKDAKHIALRFSHIFQQMAEEKQQESVVTSLTKINIVRERTKSVSMMQLHSSIESLIDDPGSCSGSPTIEHRLRSRKLSNSELQLHTTKCENSSGYGDSSDDLTNKIGSKTKRRKHKTPSTTFQQKNNRKVSQAGQVQTDYVNGEWSSHIYETNGLSSYSSNIEHETLLSNERKIWCATGLTDKNYNKYHSKFTVNQEYMNMENIGPK